MRLLRSLGLLSCFYVLWLAACGEAPEATPPTETHAGPNVVLITLDTLRADRLGSYGAPGDPTPHLDALAAEGVRFTAAVSPMPVTRPSHFSMLTSRYPRGHGSMSNAEPLAEGVPTLTEVLAEAGYRTAAFTGVKLLAPGSGAERGFDLFEAPSRGEDRIAEEVVPPAIAWLRESAGEQPFFLWLHLYDPHMPYAPPAPFAGEPPAGLAEELPFFSRPLLAPLLERTGGDLPQNVLDFALAQYEGEVRYTDLWVGRLLDALAESGAGDDTLVVLTADHGECFGGGIYFEHGTCLYEGAVHVPLILRLPTSRAGSPPAGSTLEHPVELLDLAPTVLEIVGLPVPEVFAGHSLLAPPEDDPLAFFQNPRYDPGARERRAERRERLQSVAGEPLRPVVQGELVGARGARWKLLLGEGGLQELYDLEADRGETQDVAAEHPEVVEAMRVRLAEWLRAHPAPDVLPGAVDEELEKTLRSLGY